MYISTKGTSPKARPILFSGPMVRALLEGRKTQSRRIIKPQPQGTPYSTHEWAYNLANGQGVHWREAPTDQQIKEKGDRLKGRIFPFKKDNGSRYGILCPHGRPGDYLWCRETWADTNGENGPMLSYRAGGERFLVDESYPVDCSRYPNCRFSMWCGDLQRGEPGHSWRPSIHMPRWASRLTLELTGVRVERLQEISEADAKAEGAGDKVGFAEIWESINGEETWEANPFVWVLEFHVHQQNVDVLLAQRAAA